MTEKATSVTAVPSAAKAGGAPARPDPVGRVANRLQTLGQADLAARTKAYKLGHHRFQPVVRDGQVFAWLPGFRDPRWGVADEVYDISDLVEARAVADEVHPAADGRAVIAGWAHLTELPAESHDAVTVVVTPPSGAPVRFPAQRIRRSDQTLGDPGRLKRRAFTGFVAEIETARLPATGQLTLEIRQGDLVRTAPLLARGNTELSRSLPLTIGSRRIGGHARTLQRRKGGALAVVPRRAGASRARRLVRAARRAARRTLR